MPLYNNYDWNRANRKNITSPPQRDFSRTQNQILQSWKSHSNSHWNPERAIKPHKRNKIKLDKQWTIYSATVRSCFNSSLVKHTNPPFIPIITRDKSSRARHDHVTHVVHMFVILFIYFFAQIVRTSRYKWTEFESGPKVRAMRCEKVAYGCRRWPLRSMFSFSGKTSVGACVWVEVGFFLWFVCCGMFAFFMRREKSRVFWGNLNNVGVRFEMIFLIGDSPNDVF